MFDNFSVKFGDLANKAMFIIPGDKTGYVYRKDGAIIEEALFSRKSLGRFEPTTMTLNPLIEVILWPAQEVTLH